MRRLLYTVGAVVAILGVLALLSRGDDGEEPVAVATATPDNVSTTPATPVATPATATAAATPAPATATPTPAPATPTPTPTPTATLTPTPTPSPTTTTASPTVTSLASGDRTLPDTFLDLAAAVPDPGLRLTEAYNPVCPGSSVEPIVFAGPDFADGDRFAVWVFWPYPDREAFWGDWIINSAGRAESRLDDCEPPNGYVYFNRGPLIWFVGFYGTDVEPGSPPTSGAEIRGHPVIQAFLELPR